jgi:hypothetical protein
MMARRHPAAGELAAVRRQIRREKRAGARQESQAIPYP